MAGRVLALALMALASGGCAYMQFVREPDPAVTQCGIIQIPYWYWQERAQNEVYLEEGCIETRIAQGYVPTLPQPYFFFINAGSLYTGQPTYTNP